MEIFIHLKIENLYIKYISFTFFNQYFHASTFFHRSSDREIRGRRQGTFRRQGTVLCLLFAKRRQRTVPCLRNVPPTVPFEPSPSNRPLRTVPGLLKLSIRPADRCSVSGSFHLPAGPLFIHLHGLRKTFLRRLVSVFAVTSFSAVSFF